MSRLTKTLPLLLLTIILSTSCVTYNKLRYFKEVSAPVERERTLKQIKPFDNLYIRVLSIDENTNALFDVNSGTTGQQFLISYQVDEAGNIDFPFIGKVKISDMTVPEASTKLQELVADYAPKATVVIRFVENKVTVLGQVENEGIYEFSSDNITVYDALALSGGITQFGNLKKVILIRQDGNKISQHQLDLSNSKINNSEYYYILPNDIVVVEPQRAIIWDYNDLTFPTLLTAITTFLTLYVLLSPNYN